MAAYGFSPGTQILLVTMLIIGLFPLMYYFYFRHKIESELKPKEAIEDLKEKVK